MGREIVAFFPFQSRLPQHRLYRDSRHSIHCVPIKSPLILMWLGGALQCAGRVRDGRDEPSGDALDFLLPAHRCNV